MACVSDPAAARLRVMSRASTMYARAGGAVGRRLSWAALVAVTVAGLALITALRRVVGVCAASYPAWTCAPEARQWVASLSCLLLLVTAIAAAILISVSDRTGHPHAVRRVAFVLLVAIAVCGAAATLDVGGFTLPPRFG